jgi:hypothetical protein
VALALGAADALCPIQSDTNVAMYKSVGAGPGSRRWENEFWKWWGGAESRINFVEMSSSHLKVQCGDLAEYKSLRVWVQPGGNAYDQQRTIGEKGKASILSFIDSKQGLYLGTCAGWFFASTDYWWAEGASAGGAAVNYAWPNTLGRYPTVEGPINAIADWDATPPYALTAVSNGEKMVYYGGPTRGLNRTSVSSPGKVLLTYSAQPGAMPAAVQDGNLLLFSAHAEAYEDADMAAIGLTKAQRVRNYQFRARAINEAAGLDWKIPSA